MGNGQAGGREVPSRETLDFHGAAVDDLDSDPIAVKEAHSHKRVGIGAVCFHCTRLAVPEYDHRVDVEQLIAAIGQDSSTTSQALEAERGNQSGWKREEAVEPGVDEGIDFPSRPVRRLEHERYSRLTGCIDAAGDRPRRALACQPR